MNLTCPLCDTVVADEPWDGSQVIGTPDGNRVAHRVCLLRNVVGGIGHLVDHDYWCLQRHDPDMGLTYYESARRVDDWVTAHGV